jgi:hypothetical protein
MPLSEPRYETRSPTEAQYELELITKINATLAWPEQVAQRHPAYFAALERPIADFVQARWENDSRGMQISVSDELRADIANELLETIAQVWTA